MKPIQSIFSKLKYPRVYAYVWHKGLRETALSTFEFVLYAFVSSVTFDYKVDNDFAMQIE